MARGGQREADQGETHGDQEDVAAALVEIENPRQRAEHICNVPKAF